MAIHRERGSNHSDCENKVRSLVASSIVDGVHTMTSSSEVNSSVSVEVSNVAVGQVLELGEVEGGTCCPTEGLEVVRSFTISFEVGGSCDVGGVKLVGQVLEARDRKD